MSNRRSGFWATIQLIAILLALLALFPLRSVGGEICANSLLIIWLLLAVSTVADLLCKSRWRLGRLILSLLILTAILFTAYTRLWKESSIEPGPETPIRALIVQLHNPEADLGNLIAKISPNLVVIFTDPGILIGPQVRDVPGYKVIEGTDNSSSVPVLLTNIPIVDFRTDLGLDSPEAIVAHLGKGVKGSDKESFRVVAFNAGQPFDRSTIAANRLVQRRSMLQIRHGTEPVIVFAALHANALNSRIDHLKEAGKVSQLLSHGDIWQIFNPLVGFSSHVSVFQRGFEDLVETSSEVGPNYDIRVIANDPRQ